MSSSILVFIEHRDGVLNKTSLEAIAAAQSLGSQMQQPLTAVVLGSDPGGLAQEIAGYDLAKVLKASHAKLKDYTPDGYSDAMEAVVRQLNPQLVVMPHTYLVRDFAPKLAARFGKSLISDCIRAQATGNSLSFTRRIFLGKLDADVVSDGAAPVFATFQSGAYRPDQAAKGSGAAIEEMPVEVGEIRMTPEAAFQEVKQAVDLSKADIIVAVGRGIKSKDNLALAED
jgi:electron transfer flavoprotein alpha subunit